MTHSAVQQTACLHHLLARQAELRPTAPALLAPGRPALNYRALWRQVMQTAAGLRSLGLGQQDTVAVVLPNGPEMAAAFLAISAAATCAPLNPAYTAAEFEFYLQDLQARAVVIAAGDDGPVRDVAAARGIRVVELAVEPAAEAGLFSLLGLPSGEDATLARPDDVALVLHTSGTTARPKLVPLTHVNLFASALAIARSLQLTESDRALNAMPLFHIHGLMGVLASSHAVGAAVICAPGFAATDFFAWARELGATWYSAVPTLHQATLEQAERHPESVPHLRFLRSCSASLPPRLMADLERVFGIPVVEAYGMTEASHQIASNPLPPGARKPGSVGRAAGPEVAVMDAEGGLLPPRAVGEVVIRGANVTAGYGEDPEANARAFTAGWFRTGDQGYLDEEGYLFLTGRVKELINRGGEKVAPREVEEALLEHPAVSQAVCFALPHPRLGEDVGAALVLRAQVSETELRQFAAGRLASFKVPSRMVFLSEIPKGPTGKQQRIGLAEKLGLTQTAADDTPPRTPFEAEVAGVWAQVLNLASVGVETGFLEVGGDSLLAAQVAARLRDRFQVEVTIADLFRTPTVAGQAEVILQRLAQHREETERLLAELEQLPEEEAERLLGSGASTHAPSSESDEDQRDRAEA